MDWTKTGTVEAMAQWLRSKSDALCVVVIRPFNSVMAADPLLAPADCGTRLDEELPGLLAELVKARLEKKKAARVEHAPVE
jgi:cysteine synthase